MGLIGKAMRDHGGTRNPRCEQSKVGYPTDAAAMLAMTELNRLLDTNRRTSNEPYAPLRSWYQCPSCELWHVTRTPAGA